MPIVDFEQDANADFGTGNFRDDKGRVMYLSDPETASQFNKTMKGSNLRTAKNTPIVPDGPPLPNAQYLQRGQEQMDADVQELSTAVDAHAAQPPGAPAAPPAAPVVTSTGTPLPSGAPLSAAEKAPLQATPAETAALSAPAGAAPAPTGRPAQLVNALNGIHASMAARSQAPAPPATPEPFDENGLPLASVGQGDTTSVKQGRDVRRVVEEVNDLDAAGAAGDKLISDVYQQHGKQAEKGFEAQRNANRDEYGRNVTTAFEKGAEQRQAEAKVEALKAELKKNDESLDPDRYMRNMPDGKFLSMVLLAALNGGFGAMNHQQQNGVIDVMDRSIERDIDRQKEEIKSGHVRTQNDIDFYIKKGFDAATAEKLARDNLIGNLSAFKDAEAKRSGAMPEAIAQANLLIQPRLEQRAKDRAAILRTAENEVTATSRRDMQHALPQVAPGTTPQDMLALANLFDKKTEQENTKPVEDAVGHPVTANEAKDIKDEAKEYAKRKALVDSTRAQLQVLAQKLKLFKGPDGYEGSPDPGLRPLGTTALSAQAREVDRLYSLIKRADVMSMTREPSAQLQDEFGRITERPFWDSDIPGQLNALNDVLQTAEDQLRQGYNDDAVNYYQRQRQPAAAAAPPAPARPAARPAVRSAAPKPAAASAAPAAPAAATPHAAPPPRPPAPGKRPGDLRAE